VTHTHGGGGGGGGEGRENFFFNKDSVRACIEGTP
jgi:hypothetical protein